MLGFVLVAVLLRLLPPTQYGVFSAVSIVIGIGSAVATFGLQDASARYVALLKSRGEGASWEAARRITLLSVAVTCAVTAVFVVLSPSLSLYFTKSSAWTWAFLLGALWLFSSSFSLVLQGFVQGLKDYVRLARILFAARSIMVIFAVTGLIVFHSLWFAIAAWVLYNVLIIFWTGRIVMRDLRVGHFNVAAPRRAYSEIMRYAFPLGVAGVMSIVTSNADLVVVGGYLNPLSLGVYNAAVTISNVLTLVLMTPLVTAILPEAASTAHDVTDTSNGLRLAIRFVALTVLPASMLIGGISRQLLLLFTGGGSYLMGSESLAIIAVFCCSLAVQLVIFTLFQAVAKTLPVMWISGATAGIEVVLSVLLIPHLGLIGAAAARSITSVVGMVIALWVARGYMGRLDGFKFYLKALVCAAIPSALVWTFSVYVSGSLVTVVPYSLADFGVFLVCARFVNLFSEEDRSLLGHILPRQVRGLLKYI